MNKQTLFIAFFAVWCFEILRMILFFPYFTPKFSAIYIFPSYRGKLNGHPYWVSFDECFRFLNVYLFFVCSYPVMFAIVTLQVDIWAVITTNLFSLPHICHSVFSHRITNHLALRCFCFNVSFDFGGIFFWFIWP